MSLGWAHVADPFGGADNEPCFKPRKISVNKITEKLFAGNDYDRHVGSFIGEAFETHKNKFIRLDRWQMPEG